VVTAVQQVLIASPSDPALGSLARILGGSGLGVIAVADGGKSLSEAMVRKLDVLVLDLSLSLMSTSRLVKILRTNPNTKTIPILFLGEPGQVAPKDGDRVAEVVRRPFRDEDVLVRVRSMLGDARGGDAEEIEADQEGRRKEKEP
jgi:DNA-binding response OmpR family regulator